MNWLRNTSYIILFTLLASSCDDSKKAEREAQELKEEERQLVLRRHKELEKERAEAQAQAQLKIEREKELAAKILAFELEQKQAEERKAAEKAAEFARLKEHSRREACRAFVGTEFDELNLPDDTSYTNVKVLDADAQGITIRHQHGARTIPYSKLPSKIQRACKYDPEAALLEFEENSKNITPPQNSARKPSSTPKKVASKPLPPETQSPKKKAVSPRGNLKVRVVSSSNGRKRLKVTAYSNVYAEVRSRTYATPFTIRSVPPNTKVEFHTYSDTSGRYNLQLLSTRGQQLDNESYLRKSGLKGARLD
ncbi:hypothetical protein ACFSW8_05760 [Rubritalea tangerina]|uniref:Uncharacterized protein n=2 Tax=Rubritalea tangerina TaxID=430798 RepID=A0ABW4Z8T8_9BACT